MGISWLLFIAIIVIQIQSTIYKRSGLKNIAYDRKFSANAVYEGDEIQLVETISNRKPLPLPWLWLESGIHVNLRFQNQHNLAISQGEFMQNHKSIFSLMPYTQIVRRHNITCSKRGWYFLNSATITCGDLLGVVTQSKQLQTSVELIVYPRPYPIEQIPLPSHSWLGDVIVRRWIVEDPFLTSGIREYRYGDPYNQVNWKATARTGKLQVHKKDYTASHRLMIYVNFEVTDKMWRAVTDMERIERGISYAASIAQYAVDQGMEVGFGCNGYEFDKPREPVRTECTSGQDHMIGMLETMAKLVVARSVPFDTLLEREAEAETRNCEMLLITSFVSDKMQTQMHRLRELGNTVHTILLHSAEDGEGRNAHEQNAG